jgi:hypothetical protein
VSGVYAHFAIGDFSLQPYSLVYSGVGSVCAIGVVVVNVVLVGGFFLIFTPNNCTMSSSNS